MSVRRIWLCADDYGLAPGVNAAIRDLIARRRINATSVMVHPPSFNQAAADELAASASAHGARIGLHVTLTAPFRPLVSGFRPLQQGGFAAVGQTLASSLLRRFDGAALAAEVHAQLDRFVRAFGHAPDFVDGHQHVHLFPQIREAVLNLMATRLPQAWVRQCAGAQLRLAPRDPKGMLIDALSRSFRGRAAARGIATNIAFAGTYVFAPAVDFARLFPRFLAGLPDGGLIMCHPGFVDAELERLDPLTTLRQREHAYFAGERFPAALAAAHVTLL